MDSIQWRQGWYNRARLPVFRGQPNMERSAEIGAL